MISDDQKLERSVEKQIAPPTPAEMKVVRLIAEGNTHRSVGEALGLSPLTVKSHLSRLFRKYEASGKAHLVAIAFRQGWLE